jgi:hypothetical protein
MDAARHEPRIRVSDRSRGEQRLPNRVRRADGGQGPALADDHADRGARERHSALLRQCAGSIHVIEQRRGQEHDVSLLSGGRSLPPLTLSNVNAIVWPVARSNSSANGFNAARRAPPL